LGIVAAVEEGWGAIGFTARSNLLATVAGTPARQNGDRAPPVFVVGFSGELLEPDFGYANRFCSPLTHSAATIGLKGTPSGWQ
jgi:hypothetical protein